MSLTTLRDIGHPLKGKGRVSSECPAKFGRKETCRGGTDRKMSRNQEKEI